MTEEDTDMHDSIPPRVGMLEQKVHTLEHQMRDYHSERLPHRVGTLEGNVGYLLDMAKVSEQTRDNVAQMHAYVRGAAKVFVILFSALTLAVMVAGVAVALADLAPKLDAIIIDKNPPVQVDE